jgi:hypothetical protein
VSNDDKWLFAPQFNTAQLAILDLERARRSNYSPESLAFRQIQTGQNPITPLLTPNGRYVLTTNLYAPAALGGPLICVSGKQRQGGIQVIDVQKAAVDAASATLGWAFPPDAAPTRWRCRRTDLDCRLQACATFSSRVPLKTS